MKNDCTFETYTSEDGEALKLGLVGLSLGLYKEFIEPQITAERAWAGLIGGIALYEAIAPKNHLLSEGVDRMIEKHPIATRAVIGYTALHLANALPKQLDLFHKFTNTSDRL